MRLGQLPRENPNRLRSEKRPVASAPTEWRKQDRGPSGSPRLRPLIASTSGIPKPPSDADTRAGHAGGAYHGPCPPTGALLPNAVEHLSSHAIIKVSDQQLPACGKAVDNVCCCT